MADNINVDPGTGVGAVPVATDDVGGVQYQIIKIVTGADGVATPLSNAAPLPISDAGGSITVDGTVAVTGSVTASGTVAATQSGTWNIGTVTTLPAITGTVTANVGTGTQPVSGTVAATQSGVWTVIAGAPTVGTYTGDVGVTSVTPGTAATNLGKAVDAVAGATDTGVAALVIRDDVLATLSVADNDYTRMRVNSTGQLHCYTSIDSTQLDPSVAHDDADSGNPIKLGFKATASLSGLTLVAAADRTDAFAGVDGVQITRPHCNLEDVVSTGTFTDTAGSSTSFIVSSGAGVKTYLTSIILCNTSATSVVVAIKDGTTTKITLPVPATSGCVFNPPVPIPGTAATAWNFHPSAAATTIHCSGIGFKSKV